MRHLFDDWKRVARRVRDASEIRVYLDFDGTLVAYRSHPDLVKMSGKTEKALRKLAGHRKVTVAIVSGRRRAVLKMHVKIPRVRFMGLYGWEDDRNLSVSPKTAREIRRIHKTLRKMPREFRGISIEDKGISVAVHFRGASAKMRRRAQERVREGLEKYQEDLHILRSNDVWDVVPNAVHGKGAAMKRALKGAGDNVLPIFVGDDVTDEPAFETLKGGITVLAGPARKTSARYGLRDPDEVCVFLEKLETEIALKEKRA